MIGDHEEVIISRCVVVDDLLHCASAIACGCVGVEVAAKPFGGVKVFVWVY